MKKRNPGEEFVDPHDEHDEHDEIEPSQLQRMAQVFRDQLLACLEECAQGRKGLFSSH